MDTALYLNRYEQYELYFSASAYTKVTRSLSQSH